MKEMSTGIPLSVLVTSPALDLPGGVANFARLLLEHSDRAVVRFTHIAAGGGSMVSSPLWRRPFEHLAAVLRFSRTVLRIHPDVIHLNPSLNRGSLPLHVCLILFGKAVGVPVYVYFHGWDDRLALAMVRGTLGGRLLGWGLRRADHVTVQCRRFRDRLMQTGWPANRVQILPIMAEVSALQTAVQKGRPAVAPQPGPTGSPEPVCCNPANCDTTGIQTDQRQFQPKEPCSVLFLSRLERDKGVWELVEAIEWLRREHPEAPFQFVIAGDGRELAPLQAHAQATGLDRLVHFPGYVRGDEKDAAFGNADLFVFPSYHSEGAPTTVIEALAAGLPIIYTPVGALDEILGPENGSRIEPVELSGERVGREIWRLYQDPARRQAMAAANQRLARDFDVSVICARIAQIYRHVVDLAKK